MNKIQGGLILKSHEIDYEIFGDDMQVVEIELDKDETVIAEAGAMSWMDSGIGFEAKMGDGTELSGGFKNAVFGIGKRLLTGESIFLTHFSNKVSKKQKVAFGAPYPGKIIPIDLAKNNGSIICQKDAFLCAAFGTKVDIRFNKKLGTGFFGGEGFILQHLKGDGLAFIHACGTIVKKELNGETIKVDTGCVVAFDDGIDFSIEMVSGLKSMFFGGEGLFLATLKGHGTIYLQSLPFSRLADRIIKSAPGTIGGQKKGEGSLLRGFLGDIINGD